MIFRIGVPFLFQISYLYDLKPKPEPKPLIEGSLDPQTFFDGKRELKI